MANRVAIVLGAHGALGRAVVSRFNSRGWSIVGIDVLKNPECAFSVVVDPTKSWSERQNSLVESIGARYPRSEKTDLIDRAASL